MTIADLKPQAEALRAQGVSFKDIATELGISYSSAYRILRPRWAEEQRRASRDAKRKRTGVCADCGGPTRYAGKRAAVSPRCAKCHKIANKERGQAKVGTGPMQQRILAYVSEQRRFIDIAHHLGLESTGLSPHLDRLLRYGLVRRVSRGVYIRVP